MKHRKSIHLLIQKKKKGLYQIGNELIYAKTAEKALLKTTNNHIKMKG